MRLIVGLGNPDPEYQWTPHNLGFMAVDELANRHGIRVERPEGKALVGRGKRAPRETADVHESQRHLRKGAAGEVRTGCAGPAGDVGRSATAVGNDSDSSRGQRGKPQRREVGDQFAWDA